MLSLPCIAIDGPVASGKTVIGRLIATRLGFKFLDTGMMYRAVTLMASRNNLDPKDSEAVSRLAESLDMRLAACDSGDRLFVDGEDITDQLRSPEIEHNVSLVSRISGVRSALVILQRGIAKEGSVVMVGRDIGTVVLPDAELKIYLKASVETRAQRRYREMAEHQHDMCFDDVLAELKRRDRLDSERTDSPLRQAPDAVPIETDDLDIEAVANRILKLAKSS